MEIGVSHSDSSGGGTPTPAQLQIVTLLPWRFGNTTQESTASAIYVRINAFVRRAISPSDFCVLSVGQPVVGFWEPTNGPSKSAHLVSRMPTFLITIGVFLQLLFSGDLLTWQRASPATLPNNFELRQDSLYPIPQLRSAGFDYLSATPECGNFCAPTPVHSPDGSAQPRPAAGNASGRPIYRVWPLGGV